MLRRLPTLVGVAVLVTVGLAAPAEAAARACTVKNATLDRLYSGDGSALTRAITAARAGDTLVVVGTCAGSYVIDKDLVLNGNGRKNPTVLDGRGSARVLAVDFEASVRINDLTITRGRATVSGGGGIANQGDLTLTRVNVVRNSTPNSGGGIMNGGILTLVRSTVSDNVSGFDGGGIFNYGNVTTWGTLIRRNVTNGVGGGMFTEGPAWLHNSTITGNTASDCGGGLVSVNTLELDNTTVVGNHPDDTC